MEAGRDMAGAIARAAAALLVVGAVPAAGAADAAPPALALHADPARLVLGRDPGARIVIETGSGVAPVLSANVGRVSPARAEGSGRFVAEYLPPRGGYPQIAIVSALAGDRLAWIAIPLHGRGLAIARTTPRAQIRVRIGDESFGPARADRDGEARVPVVVPPGVAFAYHGEKALDLHVPPVLHLHAVAERAETRADRDEVVTLRLAAVHPDGTPRPAARIAVDVTHGTVGDVEETAPGTYRARWQLPPGPAVEASATARLEDEPGLGCTVAIARSTGPAARVTVAADPPSVEAGRTAPVALRVTVADAAGNPVAVPPSLSTSLGAAPPPVARGPGAYESSLAVPDRIEGRRRIDVVARAGEAEGAAAIELAPATVERVVLDAAQDPVLADGSREALVRVTAVDRFGNPVAVEPTASIVAGSGELRSEPAADGTTLVRYRPRRAREDATHVVAIRAGPASGEARIALVAPMRPVEIAPKLGFAASTSGAGVRSAVLAAEAGYWPERFGARLGLLFELATFGFDRTDIVAVGTTALDVAATARYVPVLLSAAWRAPASARSRWWASAGGGVAGVSSRVRVTDQPDLTASAWSRALHLTAGIDFRLGPGAPFAEARLAWHGDPHLDAFRGTLTTFALSLGYRHEAF